MKKITNEIRFNDTAFDLYKEVKGLRLFVNNKEDYCIIVDKDDNVLFEITADSGQCGGFLQVGD